jgi:hypothetical protein
VDPSGSYSGNLQHPCPFCRAACGYTISQCAINRAGGVARGRKALKASIRQAEEEERAASPQSKGRPAATMKKLFDCYSYVSKIMNKSSCRSTLTSEVIVAQVSGSIRR